MKDRLKNHIHPGAVAAVIFVVFVAVQWVWWRGLIYRPPGGGGGGGGGPFPPVERQVLVVGRSDVIVETFSGDISPGDADGPGHAARFDRPTGIALDAQGNVFAADTGNHRIRRLAPDGTTTTFAGNEAGYQDGPALHARFSSPCGVCVAPDGAVYVADTGNRCIRRILNDQVTTVVGKPAASGESAPTGGQALNLPTSIIYVPGSSPELLVTDSGDKRVRRYRLDGTFVSEQSLPGPPTSAAALAGKESRNGLPPIQLGIAMPQSGSVMLNATTIHNMPIVDEYAYADPKGPFLTHPVSLCPFGSDWLAADNTHGAIFLIHNGKAGVLAGYASTGLPFHGERDGDGAHCEFSTVSGIATDGKKYIYIADTNNNAIRRLTVPDYLVR